MSKALFFNALPNSSYITGYDRNYNADDLSDFLSIVCDTGVVKTNNDASGVPQGLKVVVASGRTINVNVGKAVIKGKAFINDALASFTLSANGTASTRYDYVVIKYDNNVSARTITLELREGTNKIPTASVLAQNNGESRVHELILAYVAIEPSASSVTVTDTRGNKDLCPWFTAVKGYDEYYDAIVEKHESTVTYATNPVITDLPSKLYNTKYSLIEVYTNGIKEAETAFTASVSGGYIVITFTTAKAVGAQITVVLSNFIDGEGMATALAQYTQLVQDVADLKGAGEFNYICNGVNDNILISNLVKTFMSANFYHSMRLNIVGNFGFTQMVIGTGVSTNPYKLFDFGTFANVPKPKVILDFSSCKEISVPVASGKYTTIFGGTKINVVGANIYAYNTDADTTIRVFDDAAKRVKADDCHFMITGYKYSYIAWGGDFTNCTGYVANVKENSYCFQTATTNTLRLVGGEYCAYTGDASKQSAILGQSAADAVSVLYGVSAPTVAMSGFYQTNSLLQWVGGGVLRCTDLISALPMIVASGIAEIRGTITKSKTSIW